MFLYFSLYVSLLFFETVAASDDDVKSDRIIDKSNWIDPSDMMNFDMVRNKMRNLEDSRDLYSQRSSFDLKSEPKSANVPFACNDDMIFSYLKQFVTKLAMKLDIDLDTKTIKELLIYDTTLLIDEKFTYVSRKFRSSDNISIHLLQEMFDEILELMKNVRKREYVSGRASLWLAATDFFQDNFLILQILQLSLILSLLAVKLISSSFRRIFFYCLCLAFFSSVIVTWFRLCYEKSAEQSGQFLESSTSTETDDDWKSYFIRPFKYLFSFGRESQIVKFQKATINPAFYVTFLQALSVTISEAVFAPLQILGRNLALFFAALLSETPVIIWLPVLIFTGFLCLASLFFLCGYKMNAFYGLLKFEPSNRNERIIEAIGKTIKNVASDNNCSILDRNRSEMTNLKLRCKSFSDLRFIERPH